MAYFIYYLCRPVIYPLRPDGSVRAANTAALMGAQLLNKLTTYHSYQYIAVGYPLQTLNQQFLTPRHFDPKTTVEKLKMAQALPHNGLRGARSAF
ncbi:MAG: hypothetical protein ACRESQ_00555 [Gammaproteobacteria bacterium]